MQTDVFQGLGSERPSHESLSGSSDPAAGAGHLLTETEAVVVQYVQQLLFLSPRVSEAVAAG